MLAKTDNASSSKITRFVSAQSGFVVTNGVFLIFRWKLSFTADTSRNAAIAVSTRSSSASNSARRACNCCKVAITGYLLQPAPILHAGDDYHSGWCLLPTPFRHHQPNDLVRPYPYNLR